MRIPVMFPAPVTISVYSKWFNRPDSYNCLMAEFEKNRPFDEFEKDINSCIENDKRVNTCKNKFMLGYSI